MMQIDTGSTAAERRRRLWAGNLQDQLRAQNLNPKQFRDRLTAAGCEVSRQCIYQWIGGETSPSIDNQAIIARALGTTVRVLFPAEVAS